MAMQPRGEGGCKGGTRSPWRCGWCRDRCDEDATWQTTRQSGLTLTKSRCAGTGTKRRNRSRNLTARHMIIHFDSKSAGKISPLRGAIWDGGALTATTASALGGHRTRFHIRGSPRESNRVTSTPKSSMRACADTFANLAASGTRARARRHRRSPRAAESPSPRSRRCRASRRGTRTRRRPRDPRGGDDSESDKVRARGGDEGETLRGPRVVVVTHIPSKNTLEPPTLVARVSAPSNSRSRRP